MSKQPTRLQQIIAKMRSLRGISAREVVEFFRQSTQRFRDLLERMRHTYYRAVIMNNDTFEEVGSYRLSLMSFYVLVSSLFVGFALLVTMLIVFTPLKRYIPGYAGSASSANVLELMDKTDVLEAKVQAHETYINDRFKFLNGKFETEKDVPKEAVAMADSLLDVKRSEADTKLRQSLEAGGGDDGESSALKSIGNIERTGNMSQIAFVAPINGSISLGYDVNKQHYAVDIVANKDTPIKATTDGYVISADWTLETGNTIVLQHANNVVSFYKHNSVNLKKVGDKVKAGEAIAIIGQTGEQSTGPHLHFELWHEGHAVNPQEYVRF